MFSETADEILKNLKSIDHKFFFSHGRPIPDCFEEPTKGALADRSITHLWFVEDDMILPPDTLSKMLETNKAVVTCDYPVNERGRGAVFKIADQVVFCGTGCLLVRREVFNELRRPYFRTDIKWNIKNYGAFLRMRPSKTTDLDGYGLHDVNFCMNLYHLGIPIHQVKPNLGQRKLINLGKAGTNDGAHNIKEWRKVKKDELLKTIRQWPVQPRGDLVTVKTPTGEVNVTESHAQTLVEKGLAERIPQRPLVIDWNHE